MESVARESGAGRATVYALRNALSISRILPRQFGNCFIVAYQVDAEYTIPLKQAYDYLCRFSTLNPISKGGLAKQLLYEAASYKAVIDHIGRSRIDGAIEYRTELEGLLKAHLKRLGKLHRYLKSTESRKLLANLLGRPEIAEKSEKHENLLHIKTNSNSKREEIRSKILAFSDLIDNPSRISELPSKSYRRLEKKPVHPNSAQRLKNPALRKVFDALRMAHLTVFPNSKFRYKWDSNISYNVLKAIEEYYSFQMDDHLNSMFEPFRAAFTYYKLIYSGKAPAQQCLGGDHFFRMVEMMVCARRQITMWEDRLDSTAKEDQRLFEEWVLAVENVARSMGIYDDPLTVGGPALRKFNKWILLKAWVDYHEAAEQLAKNLNLKMIYRSYLVPNLDNIKKRRRKTFEDLCGPAARLRAYEYSRIHEDRSYIVPPHVTPEEDAAEETIQ